jgi:hypothetical protein
VEEARRLAGRSGRVALADLPLALDAEQAAEIAEVWLFEAWAARERAKFAVPPSRLALEPGGPPARCRRRRLMVRVTGSPTTARGRRCDARPTGLCGPRRRGNDR